jgi:hypothetical protein
MMKEASSKPQPVCHYYSDYSTNAASSYLLKRP